MIRLSNRLEYIAREVPEGSRLADIGSDHALLPVYLAERKQIVKGVAGEVNEGPRDAASRQIRAAGMTGVVEARLGDGLAVIQPGEVDVISIAGMGGALIASILESGKAKLTGVQRLVLQPNVGETAVREWLLANGWSLVGERILKEDGKIYEILIAVPAGESEAEAAYGPLVLDGNIAAGFGEQLKFGPYLLREASPVWMEKWEYELDKLRKIRSRLTESDTESSRAKDTAFQSEIALIEEVLAACSRMVKP